MLKVRRLLAATDFSETAAHAAERAAMLASRTEATLELLHVVTLTPLVELRKLVTGIPADLEQRLLEAEKRQLRELAGHLRDAHGVSAGVHVTQGPLLQGLLERIDALSVDLPVIGAYGASTLRHLVLGSTAERLLSRTRTSILVVKEAPRHPYRRVLVPVDFSSASVPSLQAATVLAPGAEVLLLHAFILPFEGQLHYAGVERHEIDRYRSAARKHALERLHVLPAESGVPVAPADMVVLHGDPADVIEEQVRAHECDVVVMGKCSRGKLEERLLGSVTRRVLSECEADVLVVP